MVKAWRIVKTEFAAGSFDGEGARRFGGRWNSVGVPMVYTAATISLAVLEMIVHIGDESVLPSYSTCEVGFDESLIKRIYTKTLPANWKNSPPPPELLAIGDAWIADETSAVLQVPSVLVETESSYLLNPRHKDFKKLRLGRPVPLRLDERLFKK
jgi:RES domain-containing protein